jgi:hypothetical protein
MAIFDCEDPMNAPAKKQRAKNNEKARDRQKSPPKKKSTDDSEQIERAVYDGMQDLRAEKPKQ